MSYFYKILIYLLLFSVKAIGAELRSGTNLQTLPEPQEGRIDTNGKFVPPGNELPSGASSGQPQRKDDTLFHPNRVQDLGDGRLAIGEVVADATTREISFPAQVNMRTGPLEYALVHANGKIHESLFKTAVRPEDIHLAALLLGMKPQQASVELDLELAARMLEVPHGAEKLRLCLRERARELHLPPVVGRANRRPRESPCSLRALQND